MSINYLVLRVAGGEDHGNGVESSSKSLITTLVFLKVMETAIGTNLITSARSMMMFVRVNLSSLLPMLPNNFFRLSTLMFSSSSDERNDNLYR